MTIEWILSAVVVLALDQGTKAGVLARAPSNPDRRRPGIRLVRGRLRFGMLEDRRVILCGWLIVVVGAGFASLNYPPLQGWPAQVGVGAAVGGATGNVIDAVWRGGIVDFIDLRVWPVFNLADAAIAGGVMVALLAAL